MNNNIKISDRLKAIGDFVHDNTKIVDVGCDHAYLSIYIYQTKKNVKIIASDINSKPLLNAKENIEKYGLKDRIETRISDGLKNINSNEIDTIIISGMGANSIIDIISYDVNKLNNVSSIIVESNNNSYKVRKYLNNLNFEIVNEKLIKENNIIYEIIVFQKSKKRIKYNLRELYLGPILIKNNDKLLHEQINIIKNKYNKMINNIPKKYLIKQYKIKRILNILELK